MAKRHEPPIQSEEIRDIIRRSEELHETTMRAHLSGGSVRMPLPAIAFDELEKSELPITAHVVYDPETHSVVVDLPDPE